MSLHRLCLSLRRAGWTSTEISACCSSVPAAVLQDAIHRADIDLDPESCGVATLRESLLTADIRHTQQQPEHDL